MYQNQNQNQIPNQNFAAGQTQNAGAQTQNSSNNSGRVVVPEAKGALNQMKYEIAQELGVNLKKGYNGDLTSREAGYVGGYMTKIMFPGRRFEFARTDAIGRGIHHIEYEAEVRVI